LNQEKEYLIRNPRSKKTPAGMMKIMGDVFSLFNEGTSSIFKLNYPRDVESTEVDSSYWAKKLDIPMITAEEYLTRKVQLKH
jgi:hypothetical protein